MFLHSNINSSEFCLGDSVFSDPLYVRLLYSPPTVASQEGPQLEMWTYFPTLHGVGCSTRGRGGARAPRGAGR